MADSWYYARGDERNGPYSSRQLRDLAAAGSILGTDTVYKMGVEQGMLATKVLHLFPPVVESPPAEVATPAPPTVAVAVVDPAPPEPEPKAPEPFKEPPPRRRTASAGKGAIMMGQDGTQVKFKKQCTTCHFVDGSATTMKITTGTMKAAFFCPKCRKRRDVELRGH